MKTEDTGLYTCTASSESGETSWSASLSVENPKNPNIIFHKTPDPATFPQAPTKVNNFVQNSQTTIVIDPCPPFWSQAEGGLGTIYT